ncbi:MAG: hexosyltransferase, partial [Ruthenibacterium sp.]
MRLKIAIINQRYGLEVNGGSELYSRQIAEKLTQNYDVDAITTCALDYTTWENYYPAGVETIHGVTVRRFPVD